MPKAKDPTTPDTQTTDQPPADEQTPPPTPPDANVPSMPPPSEENLDPNEAAANARESVKSDEVKAAEAAADARNSNGGQGGASASPSVHASAPAKFITTEELAASKHPKAPEVPIAVPDAPVSNQ